MINRTRLIAAFAAGLLASAANAQAPTASPPDSLTPSGQSAISGSFYQGLPGVWINRGNRLWYCQWQGNAAPHNQHIVCDSAELTGAASAR
jgi:hypothetical protein